MADELELTRRMAQVLLAFLGDPDEPRFGFGLMESLKMSSGTLYPILTKLEKAKWITGATEKIDPAVEGRPARRYYTLTPEGEVAAVRALARTSAFYEIPARVARRARHLGLAEGSS